MGERQRRNYVIPDGITTHHLIEAMTDCMEIGTGFLRVLNHRTRMTWFVLTCRRDPPPAIIASPLSLLTGISSPPVMRAARERVASPFCVKWFET